jgi:amino acid adenylation domain-containing protein
MNYLHELFENQVALNPNLIAVKFQETEVSYVDLNNKSNQLANYLIRKGVKPGDKVLIFLDRSIEMIVSILAILKCGAIYVPFSPKTTKYLFEVLLNDFDNPVIICNSNFNFELSNIHKINLDHEIETISNESEILPNIEIDPKIGAVILYTSGSTGIPKGVVLSHQSLVNRLQWDSIEYNHSKNDIVLQHASCNFDFSILEIFMALGNGGKLVLARPDFHYESSYLLKLIQKENITKMGSVPSLLKSYINVTEFEKCTSLKQVFLGGESLYHDLTKSFFEKSSAELINIYGPTETSISVLNYKCIRNNHNEIIPIGYPVANMRIYLVDEHNKLVKDGEIGEILIAGIGVANEYYNRPEMTQKHFFIDPFYVANDERIFKTGDYGKKLPNGAIQFCGRKDNQIKIRGLRVELEEIDHHLNLNPYIKQCIVHIIETANFQKKLVAYIVPDIEKGFNIDLVKKALFKKLSDYMIPSFFVKMEKFTLTPNGKIDRNTLPFPTALNCFKTSNFEAPKNDLQKTIAAIWSSVLKIEVISINESFTNLGGDSLALLEIHQLLEAKLSFKFPIFLLAKYKTILEIATEIEIYKTKSEEKAAHIHLQREGNGKTPIVYVSPSYGNAHLNSINLMGNIADDFPFIATTDFKIDYECFPETVEACAKIYLEELEMLYPSNEYIFGGYSMGGLIALEMISLLKNKGIVIKGLFLIDTFHPSVISFRDKTKFIKYLYYARKFIIADLSKKRQLISMRKQQLSLRKQQSENLNTRNKVSKKIVVKQDMDLLHKTALKYIPKNNTVDTVLITANESIDFALNFLIDENTSRWKRLTKANFLIHNVSTTHNSLLLIPYVKDVSNILNQTILKEI